MPHVIVTRGSFRFQEDCRSHADEDVRHTICRIAMVHAGLFRAEGHRPTARIHDEIGDEGKQLDLVKLGFLAPEPSTNFDILKE